MAAGLGFKTFTTGEVLTAADTNGYLMQGILVFASAAARDSAITSPQEGQFAYLKDTNVTTYYTGSAWANVDTTGMTNPMTTTGDSIYSSSGSTPARLGIGSTGQVLTVAGGIPSWATPAAGGGITLISETVASALGSLSLSSIPSTYKDLVLVYNGITNSGSSGAFGIRFNNNSTAGIYKGKYVGFQPTLQFATWTGADISRAATIGNWPFGSDAPTSAALESNPSGVLTIYNYASTTKTKVYQYQFYTQNSGPTEMFFNILGTFDTTTAISSIDVFNAGSGTFSNAADTSIRLYGVS